MASPSGPKVQIIKPKEHIIKSMKNEAQYLMQMGRAQYAPIRSIKRSWKYKDGKTKLKKLGVSTGLTLVGIGVSVATGGAALPVLFAVAAGTFLVSKTVDIGFTTLCGSDYVGATKTREFVENYTPVDFDTKGETKRLAERAHKTIRRACQHYRTAWEKLEALKEKNKHSVASCDEAAKRLILLWQAKRHLDKSWLYIHPAFYLSKVMFDHYTKCRNDWLGGQGSSGKEEVLTEYVDTCMDWHDGNPCLSNPCYWESVPKGAVPAEENLWDDHTMKEAKERIKKIKKCMEGDPTLEVPTIPLGSDDTKGLYFDVHAKYLNRSPLIKLKHKFQNAWERKTLTERAAFVGGQVASAASAATAMVSVPDFVGKATDTVMGFALQAGEEMVDDSLEKVTDQLATTFARTPTRGTGTAAGKEGQENLQRASIHFCEAAELYDKLPGLYDKYYNQIDAGDGDICGGTIDLLIQNYKLKHHYVQAQESLGEAIEMTEACALALRKDLRNLKRYHNALVEHIEEFMAKKDHSGCKEYCVHVQPDLGVFYTQT